MAEPPVDTTLARRRSERAAFARGEATSTIVELMADPEMRLRADTAFAGVRAGIQARALSDRETKMNFEVHHTIQVAREAFILAFSRTGSPEEAARLTEARITSAPQDETALKPDARKAVVVPDGSRQGSDPERPVALDVSTSQDRITITDGNGREIVIEIEGGDVRVHACNVSSEEPVSVRIPVSGEIATWHEARFEANNADDGMSFPM